MVYLEYHTETKQVVEIHDSEPTLSDGYSVAFSNQFEVGDEFEHTIWINEVVEGELVSYSAVRNNPNANRLLQENLELKQSNQQLRNDLDSAILELSTAIAMQGVNNDV